MTIKEWLTPDFFALNVILVALLMNLTIFGIVSNFTEDLKIGEKFQAAIYASTIFMTAIYLVMVLLGFWDIIPRFPYLYDNKYNFLLLGTGPVFGGKGPIFIAIILGILTGAPAGFLLGERKTLRISSAVGAMVSVLIIVALTLLWITNQT